MKRCLDEADEENVRGSLEGRCKVAERIAG